EGFLFLTVSESRTQLMNKTKAVEKILEIVDKALVIPKKRVATKPSRDQKQKRLDAKKNLSQKKENRKFRY
ncbi:MAG: aminoacyl-tRNA hydrolase, partial [Chryseobacterium sp.]